MFRILLKARTLLSHRLSTTANHSEKFSTLQSSSPPAPQLYLPTRQRLSLNLRCYSKEISDAGEGLAPRAYQKPSPFQQRVLVMAKMYPSVDKVPDRVTRSQMKKAMDMFRVRSSICMAALVFLFAAIMALIGRKQRNDGQTLHKIALERRQH